MTRSRRKKTPSAFQENFNRILRERNLTLRVAAELMGLPLSTVAEYTHGSTPSNLEAIGQFCQKLNIDFQWLLTGHKSTPQLGELSLEELFDERDSGWDGLYRIRATRLVPKSKSKGGKER